MHRMIQVWLTNKPGALMRVAGTLTAPGINITAMTYAPDPGKAGAARMTVAADIAPHMLPRAMARLNKLIDVRSAIDVTDESRGAKPATRLGIAC